MSIQLNAAARVTATQLKELQFKLEHVLSLIDKAMEDHGHISASDPLMHQKRDLERKIVDLKRGKK